jgi:hypothetical protein
VKKFPAVAIGDENHGSLTLMGLDRERHAWKPVLTPGSRYGLPAF